MDDGYVAAILVLLAALIFLVIVDIFVRLFKKRDTSDPTNEIISMVNEGHEQGMLETSEATMINNIF